MSFDKKACIKEGGKKGVDLVGMCDLGGVKFFNVTIDGANGLLEALDCVLEGMNAPVDESAEERKGGAGHLGKMVYSAADPGKTLALLCNIPKALQEQHTEQISIASWVEKVVAAAGGEVTKREETEETVKVLLTAKDGEFPLKMRDAAQAAGFAFLRDAGLLPADDSDDDGVNYADAAGVEW